MKKESKLCTTILQHTMSNDNNNTKERGYTLEQYVQRRETLTMLLNKINLLNKDISNYILHFAMVPINGVQEEIAIISIKELSNKIFLDNYYYKYVLKKVDKRYYGWYLVHNSKLKKI